MANTIWSAIGETGTSGSGSGSGPATNAMLDYTPGVEEFTNLGFSTPARILPGTEQARRSATHLFPALPPSRRKPCGSIRRQRSARCRVTRRSVTSGFPA